MGDESGVVVSGGYSAPSEYELWRDALMITATAMRRESYPDKASLRTLAWETRDLLREETAGRVDFAVQYRELHVEWRSLLDQVTAALAIHHPCLRPVEAARRERVRRQIRRVKRRAARRWTT
jgi:hypothetical protein